MRRSNESGFNPYTKKETPDWVREIQTAFKAWKKTYEDMVKELGEDFGDGTEMGDINRRLFLEINTILYDTIKIMHNTPGCIPLDTGDQTRMAVDFDHENKSMEFSKISEPVEEQYFLPHTYELFEIMPFARMDEAEYDTHSPASKNFVGFEQIKHEKATGKAVFYLFTDLAPITPEVLNSESRDLPFQSAQRARDMSCLKPWQVEMIIESIDQTTIDENDRVLLDKLKSDICAIQKKFLETKAYAKKIMAERIKKRILNLTNILNEKFSAQLPKSIDIMDSEYEKGERKTGHYFLPHEKRLVAAPLDRGYFGGEAKPNFKKASDAPEEEWLNTGLLGDMLIRNTLAQDIYESIKR